MKQTPLVYPRCLMACKPWRLLVGVIGRGCPARGGPLAGFSYEMRRLHAFRLLGAPGKMAIALRRVRATLRQLSWPDHRALRQRRARGATPLTCPRCRRAPGRSPLLAA